jgi:hypothetical protein
MGSNMAIGATLLYLTRSKRIALSAAGCAALIRSDQPRITGDISSKDRGEAGILTIGSSFKPNMPGLPNLAQLGRGWSPEHDALAALRHPVRGSASDRSGLNRHAAPFGCA